MGNAASLRTHIASGCFCQSWASCPHAVLENPQLEECELTKYPNTIYTIYEDHLPKEYFPLLSNYLVTSIGSFYTASSWKSNEFCRFWFWGIELFVGCECRFQIHFVSFENFKYFLLIIWFFVFLELMATFNLIVFFFKFGNDISNTQTVQYPKMYTLFIRCLQTGIYAAIELTG